MKTHFELNALINAIVGNNLIDTSDFATTIEVVKRQHKLIQSEFEELREGIETKNITEIRDGLGDVIVTVDGMYCRLGLEYPNVQSWDKKGYTVNDYVRSLESDLNTIAEMTVAESFGNSNGFFLHKLETYCNAILWSVYQLADIYGIDIMADQQAIFDSNMSKFDTDIEVARKGVEKYSVLGVATDLFPNRIGNMTYHVIKCTADCVGTDGKRYGVGKFLKSIYFKEPVLSDLPADAPILTMMA